MLKKMLVILIVFCVIPCVASANLLTNPGFENQVLDGWGSEYDQDWAEGWLSLGDPSLSWVTNTFQESGLQSLKMFGPWDPFGAVGVKQTLSATEGQIWIAEVSSLNSSSDPLGVGNFSVMKIEFTDLNEDPVGGEGWSLGYNLFEVLVADEFSPLDNWQLASLETAPAPADTVFANYVLLKVQGVYSTGGSVFLDNASSIPEPATFLLLGLGGLLLRKRIV